MRRRRRRPCAALRGRGLARRWSSSRQRSSPVPGCRRRRRWRPCGSSSPWPERPWSRSSRRRRSWPVPSGGAVLVAAAFVAGALAAVFAAGLAAVVVARLEAAAFLVVLVAAATPVADGSIVTVMPWSPRARRTTRPRAGPHVSGAHGLGHLRAGHRAGRGPLADEGLQGLVRELRRECARLGGLVGHRRHRLPFVADGRTPRAREATVRKRRGRSCATPWSRGRVVLGRGGDEVRTHIIKRTGRSSTSPRRIGVRVADRAAGPRRPAQRPACGALSP